MTLRELAQRTLIRYRSSGLYPLVTFISADGEVEVDVRCNPNRIHQVYDPATLERVNVRKSTVSVPEATLTDAGFPVRNSDNEVFLKDVIVKFLDSAGNMCNFKIAEWHPDETIGNIMCVLDELTLTT